MAGSNPVPESRNRLTIILPALLLLATAAIFVLALIVVKRVPIGAMYWDLYIYFDAVQRIRLGQIPAVDFFMPAGPFGYWLFDWGLRLFPEGQPLLLVSWSLVAVTGPVMAIVCTAVSRRSLAEALFYLVPFLILTALPFNTLEYYPFPGSDGFGIYNRQGAQLLYVLVVTVVGLRNSWLMAVLIALLMTVMCLTKITAFAAGGLICLFALLALRIPLRHAALSAALFLVALAGLQILNGIPLAYLGDILTLVRMNEGSLLPRYLQGASINVIALASGGILGLMTLLWPAAADAPQSTAHWMRWHEKIAATLDRTGLWIGVTLLASLIYETQNTGSQAMIAAIPVAYPALAKALQNPRRFANVTRVALAALLIAPPLAMVLQKSARAWVGSIQNVAIETPNLKTVGSVNARPFFVRQAEAHLKVALEHPDTFDAYIDAGELPSPLLYSNFEFQIRLLWIMDGLVRQLQRVEQEKDIRFDTIMTLDFTNPIPWAMDRAAPKHISIGADPTRTVPEPEEDAGQAVADVDLAVIPTCAARANTAHLLRIYQPHLNEHRRVRLTPCYDGFVHRRFAGAFPAARMPASNETAPAQGADAAIQEN